MCESECSIKADRSIASSLRLTWPAFFETFGRLTEIQRQSIPPILGGKDVLLCSCTASGKTEAVCAPLLERLANEKPHWTILYVTPTRALANDLFERLRTPIDRLGMRLVRRTGDHKQTLNPIPELLITTPESFDSLMCRGRTSEPIGHVLAAVRAVILDEIHLIANGCRGEQVIWLLKRLELLRHHAKRVRWVSSSGFQTIALSATIREPTVIRDRFMPDAEIVCVGDSRNIEVVDCPDSTGSVEANLRPYLERLGTPDKILVFCNSRHRVDTLALGIREQVQRLDYRVFAHHGSLSQKLREQAEHAARIYRNVIIVATSTLEIGIDIGDIDLVVLDGPAPDMPALLQRIGRGNRRRGDTRVMPCSGNLSEVLIHSSMIGEARRGYLGEGEWGPCYSVAIQQIASYIMQGPGRSRSRSKILQFLSYRMGGHEASELLDHLVSAGDFIAEHDHMRLSEEWIEKCASGSVHSTIERPAGQSVVDADTGSCIAEGVRVGGLGSIAVGGDVFRIADWDKRRVYVRRSTEEFARLGDWSYTSRAWFRGAGQPQAVRRYLGVADAVWPVLCLNGLHRVFHFGGSRRRVVLEFLRDMAQVEAQVNDWFLDLSPSDAAAKPRWLEDIRPGVLTLSILNHVPRIERLLGRPSTNAKLPSSLRATEIKLWLSIKKENQAIGGAAWSPVQDESLRIALTDVSENLARKRR